jgi:hypothetical protein
MYFRMGFVGVQSLLFGLVLGGNSLRTEALEERFRWHFSSD